MAFPPAHALVGAGVAEMALTVAPLPRWKAWAVAAVLAVLPDLDFGFGMLMGRAAAYHGTFTHSAVAVVVVSLFAALAGREWGFLAAAAYGSHLFVDLLDDRGRTNVLLAWPFSDRQPDAIARVFPVVPFEQGHGVWGAAGSLFTPHVFGQLARQTLVGLLFFLVLVAWAALIRAIALVRAGRR
jgi:hypothetical protein